MMPAGSRTGPRHGIALIEAVLSSVVIGLMFIAAMRLVTAARAGESDVEHRCLAAHLAAELMSEILSRPYADPDEVPLFGLEPGELGATRRSAFDDVDDYHGWIESPPQEPDGAARTYLVGWSRSAQVVLVNPAAPDEASLVDLGVKKITVTIARDGATLARLTALRTRAVPR
jgi:hypothetical protein